MTGCSAGRRSSRATSSRAAFPASVPDPSGSRWRRPLASSSSAFAFVVIRDRLRRPLAFQDWAWSRWPRSRSSTTRSFCPGRTFHLDHSFYVTVPLLFYVAYRAITFGEAALARAGATRGSRGSRQAHAHASSPRRLTPNAPLSPLDAVRGCRAASRRSCVREPGPKRSASTVPGKTTTP